jgi:hypothetical protein
MWSSSIGTTSKIKSIIMGQQGTLKKERDKEEYVYTLRTWQRVLF